MINKARFEKMYFNTVKTYTINEFETKFISKYFKSKN